MVTVMAANSQFAMAVHILAVLARSGEMNVKSGFIADSVNTNPVVIRRLMGQLGQAGLVLSQTGSLGGTRLALDPSEITLCSVYKAVECGEVFSLHAKTPSKDCPIGKNIESVLCELQKEIDRAVGERLGQFTLMDLINKVEAKTIAA